MDMPGDKDYFELYLENFTDSPSLIIVRSAELKHFPKEYIKEPVLDLCCGDGFFAKALGLKNAYGCDIDPSALEKARRLKEVYKEVEFCDARTLEKYPSNFFNTVISNCALEHVDGIELALESISRVLKKDGVLIFTVPSENLNKWFPGSKDKLFKFNKRQMHLNIYPIEDWEELLTKNSFEVEEYFYLFNEKQYRIAIFFDALPELLPKPIFALYYMMIKVLPKAIKKIIFQKSFKTNLL
jgi:SAM-dependent methyltransferase